MRSGSATELSAYTYQRAIRLYPCSYYQQDLHSNLYHTILCDDESRNRRHGRAS